MLLNDFLEEHKAFPEEQRKVQEMQASTAPQKKRIETLADDVSAQLEPIKSAPGDD
jgi:tellurite resistance-related uncharacterized protein